MKKASITETKNRLSARCSIRVRHGETVLIMDRGNPVARLEPVQQGTGGGGNSGPFGPFGARRDYPAIPACRRGQAASAAAA